MSTGTLRGTTYTHPQIKTFIINKLLTAKNLSSAKYNTKDGDLYLHFAEIVNSNLEFYYEIFKKRYITNKKFKSKLYLDARCMCLDLLEYSQDMFEECLNSRKGDKLENCFNILMIATINALRHDGVLSILVNRYYKNTFNIAINKLKRNRIVNEGFLLKVSIMRCGMF